MKKFLLALALIPGLSWAQTAPTRPNGDNTNAVATTAFVQNTLSTSPSITAPEFLANGSNLIGGFQKLGTRTWNFDYASQNIGSGANVNTLEICSDLPCNIPMSISDDGMVSVGNLVATFPSINGDLSDTTGPGIRVAGDASFSDWRVYGDLPVSITSTANNGSGLIRCTVASTSGLSTGNKIQVGGASLGASGVVTITVIDVTHFDIQGSTFTSAGSGWYGSGANSIAVAWAYPDAIPTTRRLYSGSALNVDGTGGSFIIMHPDSQLTAVADPGALELFAYGSAGSGTYFNKVRIGARNGVNSIGDIAVFDLTNSYITSDLNVGNGGPTEPLTVHLGTNLNVFTGLSGGTPEIWAVNDANSASTNMNIDALVLALNTQSGGTIKVGTGAFTANGTVATAMSSLGPSGSHTTIQEWFTVTDSAGIVRYIPAF